MLQELYAGSIADALNRSTEVPVSVLDSIISSIPEPMDAFAALNTGLNINVIAEIKRASPSKGFLAEISNPAELAEVYEASGAAAISVLTEQRQFKGSLQDLKAVAETVRVPVLRKDFIANEYQILEARAAGADIVLLIVAGLNQGQLEHLFGFASSLGLAVLVETHSKDEVKRAIDTGAQIIGINARNLETFETDLGLFGKLVGELPRNTIAVAESAVRSAMDVATYAAQGAGVVLVGEALVTGNPSELIREFTAIEKTRIV